MICSNVKFTVDKRNRLCLVLQQVALIKCPVHQATGGSRKSVMEQEYSQLDDETG